jgi:hypothetical protein
MPQVMKFRLFAFVALGVMSYVVVSAARAQTPPVCPPPPAGATGCKCAAAACQAPDAGKACDSFTKACTKDTDCYGNTANGAYFHAVVANPQTCVNVGPLAGGGCNNGAQTDCTVRRHCKCDLFFNFCTTNDSAITPGGNYQPCQVVVAQQQGG